MNVPETLINFRVYKDGKDLLGLANVDLPDLKAITVSTKGAGMAGTVDAPVRGHYDSLEMQLNWNVLTKPGVVLAAPTGTHLDMRGAMQVKDTETGGYKVSPIKVVVNATPKSTKMGKFDMGTTSDAGNTLEVTYIKITIDGEDIVEIDKYNYICKIDGVDYLADVREALGL